MGDRSVCLRALESTGTMRSFLSHAPKARGLGPTPIAIGMLDTDFRARKFLPIARLLASDLLQRWQPWRKGPV